MVQVIPAPKFFDFPSREPASQNHTSESFAIRSSCPISFFFVSKHPQKYNPGVKNFIAGVSHQKCTFLPSSVCLGLQTIYYTMDAYEVVRCK